MNLQSLMDPNYWSSLVSSPRVAITHLLDLLLVSIIIYQFIKLISGTKMMPLVRGVVIFILLQIVADQFDLETISWLMNQVLTYGIIAMVVLFAPEFRSVLEHLGRTPERLTATRKLRGNSLIDALLKSVDYMAPRKIGALIAVEGAHTLQEYIATGIPLEADVTSELLINIFIPNTPLHDGAVIIKDNKIATACSYFPLSESTDISKEFGTRHRAAIGLSEMTDAVVLIISEETGDISLAHKRSFYHGLTRDQLKKLLTDILEEPADKKSLNIWNKIGGKIDDN